MSLRTILATAVATALLSSASVFAQTLTVTPDPLVEGATATIDYHNAGLAGETVTIEIDNGQRNGTLTATIEIVLDDDGSGTGTWTVPDWLMANFNAPGVAEQGFPIV